MKRLVLTGAALLVLGAALGCRPQRHGHHDAAHARHVGPPRFGGPRGRHLRFAQGPVAV